MSLENVHCNLCDTKKKAQRIKRVRRKTVSIVFICFTWYTQNFGQVWCITEKPSRDVIWKAMWHEIFRTIYSHSTRRTT